MTDDAIVDQDHDRIHLSGPDFGAAERDAMLAAFDAPWTGQAGAALLEFESALAERAGTDSAVALVSGTAALHLGLRVLGVIRGDTVLIPTLAPIAAANAVRYLGAVPYFVDAEPHTVTIDPALLTDTLQQLSEADRKPAAVIAVDVYGNCADYDRIREVCDQYDVPVLEDASVAIGASYRRSPAGSFGDLAVFAFDDENIVATGGGGALVGPSPYIERARRLATAVSVCSEATEQVELGYSYRMANLLAAIGGAQLTRLDDMVAQKRTLHDRYVDGFSDVAGLHVYSQSGFGRSNGWMTVLGLNERQHPTPDEICKALRVVHDIEVRQTLKPLHTQRLFADSEVVGGEIAERFHRQGLCLPSAPSLTEDGQMRVIEAVRVAIGAVMSATTVDLGAIEFDEGQNEASSATSAQSDDHAVAG